MAEGAEKDDKDDGLGAGAIAAVIAVAGNPPLPTNTPLLHPFCPVTTRGVGVGVGVGVVPCICRC